MPDKPEQFIKKTMVSAVYMAAGLMFILFVIIAKIGKVSPKFFLTFPIIFIILFFYFMQLPSVIIQRKNKEISKEIVFMGRFLIIELESGVPLYDSLINVSKNYKNIGKYFREITNKVDLGTPLDQALNEAIEMTPSSNLRKLLWQILNSLRTGSDITRSISSVADQITREQLIEIKEYGKKLNPLAMFYMMIAIIIPTLGTTMLIVVSTFVDIELNLFSLMMLAFMLGFMQFMFFAIIQSSRPAVEL